MLATVLTSARIPMVTTGRCLPRSASAYENAVTSCDDEWDDMPPTSSTSFCESVDEEETEEEKIAVETKTIEMLVDRDTEQPNGMAFRMVGSRSRGVFIDYVDPGSPQSQHLREGDRLLRCNKISLQAVSVDQAASIFRFWMNRTDSLMLLIERRADGESVMLKRRSKAKLSMCNEQREQTRQFGPGRATLRLTSSKSAEVFRCHDEQSSFRLKTPQYECFDTSANSTAKSVCPHCHSHTRLLYLHQFSHGFVQNAFRFLTVSRSSYSLL